MNKNKSALMDRLASRLGYVPKAELDAMARAHATDLADADAEHEEWTAMAMRLRRRAELIRNNARRLFEIGVAAGAPKNCPTCWDQSINGNAGGYRLSCVCGPLRPKCAYQACVRGLQITEHPIE